MKISILLFLATLSVAPGEDLLSESDLSNWTFESKAGAEAAKKSWKLQDGVLSTTGKPIGFIRSGKSYGDYTLTFEWRWLPGSENGNSGLLFHAGETPEGNDWPQCVESQLQQGNAGDFWMIGETLQAPGKNEARRWHRTADPAEKPVGEWNMMTVVCKADTVTVKVNGTIVNEGTNLSTTSGNICFQAEGAPIELRAIAVESLEP